MFIYLVSFIIPFVFLHSLLFFLLCGKKSIRSELPINAQDNNNEKKTNKNVQLKQIKEKARVSPPSEKIAFK